MRILLLSDSHGDRAGIRLAAEEAAKGGTVDAVLHMGDGAGDFASLTAWFQAMNPAIELYGVRGNCDFATDFPYSRVLTLDGVRLLITHGHHYSVKTTLSILDDEAAGSDCAIALFGHTHEPCMEMKRTLLINPGSIRDGRYALLELNQGQPRVHLRHL